MRDAVKEEMARFMEDTCLFRLDRSAYKRAYRQGLLWCAGYIACAALSLLASLLLLPTYTHIWTPYLKWQDALVALLCFITLLGLGGATFVVRFLHALHEGYKIGVLHFVKGTSIAARDLSQENFISIFWMMHTTFWCFIVVLLGLSPEILLGITLRLSNPLLAVVMTALVGLLSLAGLVVSGVCGFFICIGMLGLIKLCYKLGSLHSYPLDNRITVRIDGSLLTLIYPDKPESMVDLAALTPEDREHLLALLQESAVEVQQQAAELMGV
jgi:hypothetical protein